MEVRQVKPYVISDLVVAGGAFSLVVLGFHSASGFVECFLSFLVNDGHIFGKVGGGGIGEWRRLGQVRKDTWVSAEEYHEETLSGSTVNAIVVSELSEGEPVAPVGLSVINEDAKVLFDFLVNLFGLSIGLWVEGHGCVWGNVEHLV